MSQEKAIEPQLAGKVIARLVEVTPLMLTHYRLELTDGTMIEFHGGAVGYESTDAWYEIEQKEARS